MKETKKVGILWKRSSWTSCCSKNYSWKLKNVELSDEGILQYWSIDEEAGVKKNVFVPLGGVRVLPRRKEILYGKRGKYVFMITGQDNVLYFGADSKQERQDWIEALEDASLKKDHNAGHTLKVMWGLFRLADKDFSGTISKSEAQQIFHRMNAGCSKSQISAAFRRRTVVGLKKDLGFEKFCDMWKELTLNEYDVQEFRMAGGQGVDALITPTQLRAYFQQKGNLEVTDEFVISVIANRLGLGETGSIDTTPLNCDIFMFSDIIQSEDNGILHPSVIKEVYQDMSYPLCDYFINSSHNTYLTGDQLKSDSAIDMYRIAFEQGFRCVELDCWDGPDGDPVVYHGYTMTTKISFEDIIRCIRDHAFQTSPYPLILSLENHCSVSQQQRMAEIMKNVLGDMLALPNKRDHEKLPSPADLKFTVVLKGNKSGSEHANLHPSEQDEDPVKLIESVLQDDPENMDYAMEAMKQFQRAKTSGKSQKLMERTDTLATCVDLSDLIFLDIGSKDELINSWMCGSTYAEGAPATLISNISEPMCFKLSNDYAELWKGHNRRNLTRIYPSGLRVGSSNLNPLIPWKLGCQIVAINQQEHDTSFQINNGRFLQNAGCGYVLKPGCLRSGANNGDHTLPQTCIGAGKERSGLLIIKVIAGHHLPKPDGAIRGERIDPYVKLRVFNPTGCREKCVTRVISNNGYNPCWNETFEIFVEDVEVSMFHLVCRDRDYGSRDDVIGVFSLPVELLQLGLRFIPLTGVGGAALRAPGAGTPGILCQVSWKA